MTVVDAHVHVIVPELLRAAAPEQTWRPSVSRGADGQVVELGGRRSARSRLPAWVRPRSGPC
jgi:hypothetical protein